MKITHENDIKDLIDLHNKEIQDLHNSYKNGLENDKKTSSENEKQLIEKIKEITSCQTEVLNKLNDKIIHLNTMNNEDKAFIEKIYNILDKLLYQNSIEKSIILEQNNIEKNINPKKLKDNILLILESLMNFFEKNQKIEIKSTVDNIQKKLGINSITLKEFEEARNNLVKHFSVLPKKNDINNSFTTRY